MDLHLEGKVVILTGGFKGIGKGMDALNTRVRDDGDDFDVIDAHFLGGMRVMGLWGTRQRHVDRRERRSVCCCRVFASISSHGHRSGAHLWTL